MINKTVASDDEAIQKIKDNAILMVGGFGLCVRETGFELEARSGK